MPEPAWHKSTHSAEAANCLEIADTPLAVHVRDSKVPAGPRLSFPPDAWAGFLSFAVQEEAGRSGVGPQAC
ncbi:DUF397 domain-containing protein [Streptomyces sp. MS06]|uniref:DUF397 domain-containing protein n=1 Tax=Streptomyces sp. MS06 TaxID=3385974 RepID=UPI0039A3A8F1